MNTLMNRTAMSASTEGDVVLFVTEAGRFTAEDENALGKIKKLAGRAPVLAVLNKIDKQRDKTQLLATIAQMAERHPFAEIVPISAKSGDNVARLLDAITPYLPESPPLYLPEMHTDRDEIFLTAEVIREKLTILLHKELPYGLTVQVERYTEEGQGVAINAVIWVERDSQKGIVIGKGGEVLKQVGQRARKELCQLLDRRVHLELWVKVKKNWSDSESELRKFGYDSAAD